ncbi:hypothetical protein F5J12DRAFT_968327 [Pisolithus orientalis]|uniref:uncharacterized protein n=1 Tax=Pisolithus orientalis TaxID=936130 RepID=UPI002225A2BB|nr:uncharacterized protein F5J12DRAFT_968327 [Pisolithus orientalis]KAI6019952.1 hypothetical protein F5J12DRAFT_968327 [Pisolithus orientalis]
MASGFGYTGGRSRCFAYWQEFSKVYIRRSPIGFTGTDETEPRLQCYSQADAPSQCRVQADDYLECLHHTKEIERAKAVRAEFIKQAEHQAKEGRKVADLLADGVIVSVGLIQRDRGSDGKEQ